MLKDAFWALLLVLIAFSIGISFTYFIHYGFEKESLFWLSTNTLVLVITAIALFQQARASRRLADATLIPKVAFRLITALPQSPNTDEERGKKLGTRVILSNYSDFQVWVWTRLCIKINGNDYKESLGSRLDGEYSWQLNPHDIFGSNSYDFLFPIWRRYGEIEFNKLKITADIAICYSSVPEPKPRPKWISLKPYRFENGEWLNDYGVPDRPR